jgi:hypothetical protein
MPLLNVRSQTLTGATMPTSSTSLLSPDRLIAAMEAMVRSMNHQRVEDATGTLPSEAEIATERATRRALQMAAMRLITVAVRDKGAGIAQDLFTANVGRRLSPIDPIDVEMPLPTLLDEPIESFWSRWLAGVLRPGSATRSAGPSTRIIWRALCDAIAAGEAGGEQPDDPLPNLADARDWARTRGEVPEHVLAGVSLPDSLLDEALKVDLVITLPRLVVLIESRIWNGVRTGTWVTDLAATSELNQYRTAQYRELARQLTYSRPGTAAAIVTLTNRGDGPWFKGARAADRVFVPYADFGRALRMGLEDALAGDTAATTPQRVMDLMPAFVTASLIERSILGLDPAAIEPTPRSTAWSDLNAFARWAQYLPSAQAAATGQAEP